MLRNRVDPSSQLALSAPEPRFWRSRATYVSLVRKRHKAKIRGCPSCVACLLRRLLVGVGFEAAASDTTLGPRNREHPVYVGGSASIGPGGGVYVDRTITSYLDVLNIWGWLRGKGVIRD